MHLNHFSLLLAKVIEICAIGHGSGIPMPLGLEFQDSNIGFHAMIRVTVQINKYLCVYVHSVVIDRQRE